MHKKILILFSILILSACFVDKSKLREQHSFKDNTIWKVKIGKYSVSSPAYDKGKIYIAGENRTLFCIEENSGEILFQTPLKDAVKSNLLIIEGFIYINGGQYLYKINKTNGEIIWTYDNGPKRFRMYDKLDLYEGSPVIIGDKLYLGNVNGEFLILNKNSGKLIKRHMMNGAVKITPAYNDKIISVADMEGFIIAVNIATGEKIWEKRTPKPITSSPVIIDDKLYIAGRDDKLVVYDINNGKFLWSYQDGGGAWFSSDINYDEKFIYIGSSNSHIVYEISRKDSRLITPYLVYNYVFAKPTKYESDLFIIDSEVYNLPGSSMMTVFNSQGKARYEMEINSAVFSDPLIINSKIFFTTIDGFLYCVKIK